MQRRKAISLPISNGVTNLLKLILPLYERQNSLHDHKYAKRQAPLVHTYRKPDARGLTLIN